tara:strand:- start:9921 stop:10334 length:414 start_codon:yes stop_codon:yes gene_type:complete
MSETTHDAPPANIVWGVVNDILFWSKIKGGLQRTGYPLRRIRTDLELMETLKRETPSVIIVDMGNDTMNAFAVIQTLKEDEEYKEIPVLAFCNHDDVAAFTRARTLGADKVVTNGVFSMSMDDLVTELIQGNDDDEL